MRVDAEGIRVPGIRDRLLDVCFDGRRIWSLWTVRDGARTPFGRFAAWPKKLLPYLDGHARITIRESPDGRVLFDRVVHFTDADTSIAIVNSDGVELAFDKDRRLVGTFENRDDARREPLIDAIGKAIDALGEAGVEAFLAYGTALGAIRDGGFIGHDSDADLGYVSRHEHPVDVARESFALQRALSDMGFRITRYSGAAFKMHVPEGDGVERGLDVFGGYYRDGRLHLMGEICVPYERDWIYPLGTATLEGRPFPVPRNTDKFLEATYGPRWATPDPAFKFTTPASTQRMFNGLFRGTRAGRAGWDRFYSVANRAPVPEPSALARHVVETSPGTASYVDLGCGRGADVGLYAATGAHVLGLDFQTRSFLQVKNELAGNPRVRFATFNLLEIRTVLALSALAVRMPTPRVLVARHLIDTVDRAARANLWRACDLMLRGQDDLPGGGRLHLEFLCRRGRDGYAREHKVKRRKVAMIRAELEASGARILSVERYAVSQRKRPSKVCRMVVTWDRPAAGEPDGRDERGVR